jgi:calcium/calmodulin-dependent protein kinase I
MERNNGLSQEDLDAIEEISQTFANVSVHEGGEFIAKRTIGIASRDLLGQQSTTFDGRSSSIDTPISRAFHFGDNESFYEDTSRQLLNANIRAANKSIARVVEMITSALTNEHEESYGSPPNQSDDHYYEIYDLTFHPNGCFWNAMVKYSTLHEEKSITNKKIQLEHKGKCTLRAVCTTVILNDDDRLESKNSEEMGAIDIDSSARMYHDFLSSKHYSIDLKVTPEENTDTEIDTDATDKRTLKCMSDTVSRIAHDISKQLYKQTLPEFPQGCKKMPFRKIYQLNAKLKSGSFATVCAGTHRETRKQYAIKCVHRRKLSPNDDVAIFSEVNILASLDHERICSIIDFFIEDECYFIVMPLMQGGDVFDRIGNMKKFDESIARNMVFEMLKAIAYLHENDLAHCDLKPKNLLLQQKDDDSSVMLADFGFARKVYSPNSLTKQCGTPYFVAPEILLRKGYDTKADLWSVGVIMYSIMSGGVPFTGKNHKELFKAIIDGSYDFDSESWEGVSEDAKDLISKLLIKDPRQRFSATDSLRHAWIRADGRMLRRNALVSTSQRMKTFNARLTFKTTILATHDACSDKME